MLLTSPDIFRLPEVVTVPRSIKIISCDEYDLSSKNDSQKFWKVQRKHLYLFTLLRVGYSASIRPTVSLPTYCTQPTVKLLGVQAGQKEQKC